MALGADHALLLSQKDPEHDERLLRRNMETQYSYSGLRYQDES